MSYAVMHGRGNIAKLDIHIQQSLFRARKKSILEGEGRTLEKIMESVVLFAASNGQTKRIKANPTTPVERYITGTGSKDRVDAQSMRKMATKNSILTCLMFAEIATTNLRTNYRDEYSPTPTSSCYLPNLIDYAYCDVCIGCSFHYKLNHYIKIPKVEMLI